MVFTADIIIDAVARFYRIKIRDVLGTKLMRSIALPRLVAMSLTKGLTTLRSSVYRLFVCWARPYGRYARASGQLRNFAKNDPESGSGLRKATDSDSKLMVNVFSRHGDCLCLYEVVRL